MRSKWKGRHSQRQQRKNVFQAVASKLLKQKSQPYDAEDRLRYKIRRWKLDGPPAHIARRMLHNLQTVGSRCRPCVAAMVFRTLWNGWPTSARMRTCKDASKTKACVFGCTDAEDRLEHYLLCHKVWTVLELPQPQGLNLKQRNLQTMLLARRGMHEEEIVNSAIAVYAIARTVHGVRQNPCSRCEALLRLYSSEGKKCTGSAEMSSNIPRPPENSEQ